MITINKVEIDEKDLEALGWTAPQSKKRWRADKSEAYYFFSPSGFPGESEEASDDFDDRRYNMGNHFRTKEEAELARDRQLAKQRIIDYYREHETEAVDLAYWAEMHKEKYCVYFDHGANRFYLNGWGNYQCAENELYTTSKAAAQYVCDNYQADLKLMLGVK